MDGGQISLLMTRPLGVRDVINPLASSGADDPEVLDDARANAPLTVLTLDRVVSLQDYEDFARAFAGVGKAQAARLWSGEAPLVYLTVAGVEGAAVLATSELYANLRAAIDGARGSTERVEVVTYASLRFGVEAALILDERYVAADVLAAAADAVRAAFSFERRAFGQGVSAGDVLAVLQRVDGVVAADLDRLGTGRTAVDEPRLLALPARVDGGVLRPAALLTVDPDAIRLDRARDVSIVYSRYALRPRSRPSTASATPSRASRCARLLAVLAEQVDVARGEPRRGSTTTSSSRRAREWVVPYIGDLVGVPEPHMRRADAASASARRSPTRSATGGARARRDAGAARLRRRPAGPRTPSSSSTCWRRRST